MPFLKGAAARKAQEASAQKRKDKVAAVSRSAKAAKVGELGSPAAGGAESRTRVPLSNLTPARGGKQGRPSAPKLKPGAAGSAAAKRKREAAGKENDDDEPVAATPPKRRGPKPRVCTATDLGRYAAVAAVFSPAKGGAWGAARIRQVAASLAIVVGLFAGRREDAVQHTAQILSVRPDRVRSIAKATEVGGSEAVEGYVHEQAQLQAEAKRASERGQSNSAVTLDELAEIDALIQTDLVGKKVPITGAAVVRLIKRVCVRDEPLILHERTGQRVLNRLSYHWHRKTKVYRQTSQRCKVVEEYLVKYAAALKEEALGGAVICGMDESYCHTGHARTMGWGAQGNLLFSKMVNGRQVLEPGEASSAPAKEGDMAGGKGRRVIMLAAVSKHGLVADFDPAASPNAPGAKTPAPSARRKKNAPPRAARKGNYRNQGALRADTFTTKPASYTTSCWLWEANKTGKLADYRTCARACRHGGAWVCCTYDVFTVAPRRAASVCY